MIPAARWDWSTGVELSRREFRSVLAGTVLTPELLAEGFQLKHLAELNYEWLRVPEKRLLSTVTVSSQLGRVWSAPSQAFAKLQAELTVGWFPQSRGDDYEVTGSLRAGKTSGRTPFDELFVLGVKGDTGLKLRAHVATRDDRKGSAPMGHDYVLTNLEIDKRVLRKRLVTVKLGPFLDSGYVTGSSADFAAKRWLWDTGAQAKVHAMGATLIFVYGRDLRMGRNAWYVTVGR
jgi:hypothetical protein